MSKRLSEQAGLGSKKPRKVVVDDNPRKVITVVLSGVLLSLAGFWAFWPYLESECRRIPPLTVGAIFLSDLLALAWFVRFALRHASRKRLQYRPVRLKTAFGWALMGSCMLGLCVDLLTTLNYMRVEEDQYRSGERVVAKVLRMRKAAKPARTRYQLAVEFRDRDGTLVRAELETWKSKKKGWLEGTSSELIGQLLAGRISELPIRYHRDWPQRAWIEGIGPHGDSIAWFSITVICFQAIFILAGTVPFLTELQRHARSGRVPWWHDLHDVIPLSVEGAFMLFSGLLHRGWEWTTLNNAPMGF